MGQVRVIEVEEVQPQQPLPVAFFLFHGRLIIKGAGEIPVTALSLPYDGMVNTILHHAHTHLLRDHLGPQNILENVCNCFHWPGMVADVWWFCQQCPQCQRTSTYTPPPAPLVLLLVMRVPFD